ncbi:LysE family translocator [Mesobacterium pallidum]|uniref:LysE family translocator n=1 Tax=Mesobacterium pallidum TaxID=2872037 RepID=UPI001EE1E63A|nr:LysE family translocator [Mesobacterium pallidum]
MTPTLILALAGFALVSSFTPGPNNLMLMASGANFGFRRSVPHMAGVGLGFGVMVLGVGIGLMQLFDLLPWLADLLMVASALYLGWLAWKVAHAAPPAEARANARPLTFLQAAAFQWVNPKAWTMATGAITLYAPSRDLPSVALVAAMFVGAALGSTATWALLGGRVRSLLDQPRRLRVFNRTMAALMVATLIPVLWHP